MVAAIKLVEVSKLLRPVNDESHSTLATRSRPYNAGNLDPRDSEETLEKYRVKRLRFTAGWS